MDVTENSQDAPHFILQKVFGFETFRESQLEVINNILNGIETIALLPTGGGKTVIYVVAALLRKGITIVIEPLKSLMEEQVKSLQSKNVVAFFINDYLTESQIDQIISFLIDPTHKYAILFTSPEKLVGEKLMHMTRTLIAQK